MRLLKAAAPFATSTWHSTLKRVVDATVVTACSATGTAPRAGSVFIAIVSTAVSMVFGVAFGIIAGYRGGLIDTVISRIMDILLAFPVLLFSIALLAIFQGIDNIKVVFFHLGGTALRLCFYEDFRYSADLDFSLEGLEIPEALEVICAG